MAATIGPPTQPLSNMIIRTHQRAASDPARSPAASAARERTPATLAQLQRQVGNAGLLRVLGVPRLAPVVQRQPAPTVDPRVTACLAQPDEILPGRVGLVTHMDREMQLEEILGPEYPPLETQIRADSTARRFVCEAGVPAIVALWDTRTATGALDVDAARHALHSRRERYRREVMPRRRQERRLAAAEGRVRGVGTWVRDQVRSAGLASPLLVPVLPAPERGQLQQAVTGLTAALPDMEAVGPLLAAVIPQLATVVERLGRARQVIQQDPEFGVMQARAALIEASDPLDSAVAGLRAAQGRADVDALAGATADARRALTALIGQGPTLTSDDIAAVRDLVRPLAGQVGAARRQLEARPPAARRVQFLLRYLIALSSPGYAGAPSAEDNARFSPGLDDIGTDLELLFGAGPMNGDRDFFAAAAARIRAQFGVRADMAQALGRPTDLVPTQTDVQAHFARFAASTDPADRRDAASNATVRAAYEAFAGAFFEHAVIGSLADLAVASIDDVFARPIGAVGVRPLICSGYAALGARLFELAGGRVVRFILGVRASNDQLRAGATLDDAHALAEITRGGTRLFISNDAVVDSEQGGIGPNAVAWNHPEHLLFIGRGASLAAALTSVQAAVTAHKQRLP